MQHTDLEPGFLQAFRLIVVTRIVFWVVIGPILIVLQLASGEALEASDVSSLTLIDRLTLPNIGPMLAVELCLLILLVLPQVPRRLGRGYVSAMLLVGLVPPLVGYYWWPSNNPLQTPFVLFFFVMLVLIAWQYPFRYVLIYVVGLTVFQAGISYPAVDVPLAVDVGWSVLQASLMLIVGYIIVQLMAIQREQRAALAQAYEQQAAANLRLQKYAATIEELGISRERNRLARELHDTLAHSLSAVTVQLEAIRSLWSIKPDVARSILEQADETARRGLTEARGALQALRASPLRELGLVLALRELAELAAERSGAALHLHLPEQVADSLPQNVEQGVYRIAQEMLENIVRHAEARSIRFSLDQDATGLVLVVEDDGRGIQDAALHAADTGNRLGIQGMQERASLIGGRLAITSRPGEGTHVSLTIPPAGVGRGKERDGSRAGV